MALLTLDRVSVAYDNQTILKDFQLELEKVSCSPCSDRAVAAKQLRCASSPDSWKHRRASLCSAAGLYEGSGKQAELRICISELCAVPAFVCL